MLEVENSVGLDLLDLGNNYMRIRVEEVKIIHVKPNTMDATESNVIFRPLATS